MIHLKFTTMNIIKFSDNRAIRPCFNPILKQRLIIPDKRPRLAIINQLL